ncbi:MAG: BhlA/UviB family holin-like peptide [Oribacterium sp.]
MENLLVNVLESQGIWTVLFVFLLLYLIRKNDSMDEMQERRDKEYQWLLRELTEKLRLIESIEEKLDRSLPGNK